MDCLFCKIANDEIPASILHQDKDCVAFSDLHPQAPTHLLIVPRRHVASLAQTSDEDEALLGHLVRTASNLAKTQGLSGGFRVVINTGEDGGQTVHHLHLHLLGGRSMHWPPG